MRHMILEFGRDCVIRVIRLTSSTCALVMDVYCCAAKLGMVRLPVATGAVGLLVVVGAPPAPAGAGAGRGWGG